MKVFSIGFLAITCLTSLVMASYWPLSSLPTGAVYTGYTMDTVLAGLAAAAGNFQINMTSDKPSFFPKVLD